jgi:site-specific DNA-methyltransferase (adenine-specific)
VRAPRNRGRRQQGPRRRPSPKLLATDQGLLGEKQWAIYEGDARDSLPALGLRNAVCITDPVWPNMPEGMFDVADPVALFRDACRLLEPQIRRLVVQLGCDSDPRFLFAVPGSLPFVRTCWLRYNWPSCRGTVLNSGDVAYVFGDHRPGDGRKVFPGEHSVDGNRLREAPDHPCPRDLGHVMWLVEKFSVRGDLVIDPFCGSGTTGVACLRLGRRFIGLERDHKYAAAALERLKAETVGLSLSDVRAGQQPLFAEATR